MVILAWHPELNPTQQIQAVKLSGKTHKMSNVNEVVNIYKMQLKHNQHANIRTAHICVYHCGLLTYTTRNTSDYLPSASTQTSYLRCCLLERRGTGIVHVTNLFSQQNFSWLTLWTAQLTNLSGSEDMSIIQASHSLHMVALKYSTILRA